MAETDRTPRRTRRSGTAAGVALLALAALGAAGPAAPATAAETRIIHFPVEKGRPAEQQRASYQFKLLKLALERSGLAYELRPATRTMSQARQKVALANRTGSIDVAWFGASKRAESKLKPVYIPIFKGLLGWRIAFIHADKQPAFRKVETLADLRVFNAIQGLSWPDTDILRHSGIEVGEARYDLLPRMIAGGRADWFPRSVIEIWPEKKRWQGQYPELAIERHFAVVYRFALLFYVAPGDDELHRAIREGLKAAHADGSVDELFRNDPAVKKALAKANLSERTRIELPNPLITDALKAIPEKYWFDVSATGS